MGGWTMATSRRCNVHHWWFPKKDYTLPTERRFRELPCQKVRLDITTHDLLHAHSEPPEKPTHAEMTTMILRHQHRECGCY